MNLVNNTPNPLLDLPEETRVELLKKLRKSSVDKSIQEFLAEVDRPDVTQDQLEEFYRIQVEKHWTRRIEQAVMEADTVVRLAEGSSDRISSAILAALGQETFRQIASEQITPEAMNRLASVFLRARADDREDEIHTLKKEQLRQDVMGRVSLALEKFSEDVDRHPTLRPAFENLQQELAKSLSEEGKIE